MLRKANFWFFTGEDDHLATSVLFLGLTLLLGIERLYTAQYSLIRPASDEAAVYGMVGLSALVGVVLIFMSFRNRARYAANGWMLSASVLPSAAGLLLTWSITRLTLSPSLICEPAGCTFQATPIQAHGLWRLSGVILCLVGIIAGYVAKYYTLPHKKIQPIYL